MSGDLHARFGAWLTDGAAGDPPRDAAIHASVCSGCLAGIAALDGLSTVDLERAPMPASRTMVATPRRKGLLQGAAVAVVALVAVAAGVIASPLLPTGRAAETPQQQVLGTTGTPDLTSSPSAEASDSMSPSPTPTASASASSTAEATVAATAPPTIGPVLTPRPTARVTPRPPPPAPAATPVPTTKPTPTPAPTATPIATPVATPTPLPTPTPPVETPAPPSP